MGLTIYTEALDAMFKLEKQEQKRLKDFVKKFKQDSKSAAIHLEPISTFRDPLLRTARISQKYRAVLRAPEVGDVYTLLWVDNHDAAYRWAANKVVQWNDNTDSYQVYAVPEADLVQKVEPKAALQDEDEVPEGVFAELTDQQLIALGVPKPLLPSVRAVEAPDDLNALYDYLPIEPLESLSMLIEGVGYAVLFDSIQAGKSVADDRTQQQESANNRNQFYLLEDDEMLERMLNGSLSKWQIYLHREQRSVVELDAKGPIKVSGGAGTGKTVAALHRAAWLQEHGEASEERPILFTTYTKALRRNLQQSFTEMGLSSSKVNLHHIDELASTLYSEIFGSAPKILDYQREERREELWQEVLDDQVAEVKYTIDFLMREYADVILQNDITEAADYYRVARRGRGTGIGRRERISIWKLVESYQAKKAQHGYHDRSELFNLLARHYRATDDKPYRHAIADELQDFGNPELRLLRAICPEASNDLFLVGDPFQRIYGGSVVFSQVGIEVRGRRSRRLRLNYRTTERIRRYAVGIVSGESYEDFEGGTETFDGYRSLRAGEVPSYRVFYDEAEEAEYLIVEIKRSLLEIACLERRDIVVAFPARTQAKTFRTTAHAAGFELYDITTGAGSSTGIRLCTLHALKGLEFKVVLLGGISARTWPRKPRDIAPHTPEAHRYKREQLSLLYVAITRAIVKAGLSGVGEKSNILVQRSKIGLMHS